jgi:hypothetical protein
LITPANTFPMTDFPKSMSIPAKIISTGQKGNKSCQIDQGSILKLFRIRSIPAVINWTAQNILFSLC